MADPRVEKEAQSLALYGFKVSVLGWNREGLLNNFELKKPYDIYTFRFRAPYNSLVLIAFYPIFWLWVLIKLIELRPRIVHACDLDTIFPAFFYRCILANTRVIFDMFDNHSLLIEVKSQILSSIVRVIESWAAYKSNAFVTVTEGRLNFFNLEQLPSRDIIMNCCPDASVECFDQNNGKKDTFRLVYAGVVSSGRGLIELAEATKDFEDLHFIVAGRVVNQKIAETLKAFRHVKYVGQLSFEDSLRLEKTADVVPILYDLQEAINRFASPNKLFEAMMLGIPVLTSVCPDLVKKVNCGLICNYTSDSIRDHLLILKNNPELRKKLGLNGRLAFEKKYNWAFMEKKLLDLYKRLLTA